MQTSDTLESPTEEEELRDEAVKRIKRKRDFVGHVVLYVIVNAGLWAVWAIDGANTDDLWPAWVTGIWLVILLLDAYKVYKERPISDQQVQEEMRRMKRGSVRPV
jgi:fatty acid desaturase